MTQAEQATPADKAADKAAAKEASAKKLAAAKEAAAKSAAAAQAAANDPILVLEGGRVVGQKTAEAARKEGLTVVISRTTGCRTSFRRRRTSRSRCGRFCSISPTGGCARAGLRAPA